MALIVIGLLCVVGVLLVPLIIALVKTKMMSVKNSKKVMPATDSEMVPIENKLK